MIYEVAPDHQPTAFTLADLVSKIGPPASRHRKGATDIYGWWHERRFVELIVTRTGNTMMEWDRPEPTID